MNGYNNQEKLCYVQYVKVEYPRKNLFLYSLKEIMMIQGKKLIFLIDQVPKDLNPNQIGILITKEEDLHNSSNLLV
jgi:hypothetical protein